MGPVKYRMSKNDLATLTRGMARMAQVFFAAGAEAVYPSTFVDLELTAGKDGTDVDQLEATLKAHVQKPEDLALASAHPQGGNPMSEKRNRVRQKAMTGARRPRWR